MFDPAPSMKDELVAKLAARANGTAVLAHVEKRVAVAAAPPSALHRMFDNVRARHGMGDEDDKENE